MKLTILNQKGGVVKSTVTTNMDYCLSVSGKKTLIVGMDPQAHSSVIFCRDIPRNNTKKWLLRKFSYNFLDSRLRGSDAGFSTCHSRGSPVATGWPERAEIEFQLSLI